MDDIFHSQILKGIEKVCDNCDLLLFSYGLFRVNNLQKVSSVFVVHDDVKLVVIEEELSEINNIRVL